MKILLTIIVGIVFSSVAFAYDNDFNSYENYHARTKSADLNQMIRNRNEAFQVRQSQEAIQLMFLQQQRRGAHAHPPSGTGYQRIDNQRY